MTADNIRALLTEARKLAASAMEQECDDIAKACAVAIANTADAKFVIRAVSLEAKYARSRTLVPALADVVEEWEAMREAMDAWASDPRGADDSIHGRRMLSMWQRMSVWDIRAVPEEKP